MSLWGLLTGAGGLRGVGVGKLCANKAICALGSNAVIRVVAWRVGTWLVASGSSGTNIQLFYYL
eukprot:scaffold301307_cov29-Tisochrysis_lutea.AAC.1